MSGVVARAARAGWTARGRVRADERRARRGTRRAAPGRVVDRPEETRRGRVVMSSSLEDAADTASREPMDVAAMDEAWEQQTVNEIGEARKAVAVEDESAGLERRNKALSALLDQTMMDKKQLERALTQTIEAVRAENVALRIEIERVKVKAEENLESGRADMYREVEKEIESRVRKSIESETKKRIDTLRKEADKAQRFATQQASTAAKVIDQLKATVEAEAIKQNTLLTDAHEKMMKAQQQKIDALEMNVAALQEQNSSLLEYTASFDSMREERDKVANALTDKEQEIRMLTSSQDEMGGRMTSAIARATLAESKIVQMDKTVNTRVKSVQDSAALAVDTAFKAQRAAEKRAEEQQKTSESLIAAAVVRAENAESQLYRQNEILQEFAAMTEAKTKATELIVQLQEQIASQTVEIESLRALASENAKRSIDYKSEVEALEKITKRKVKESISQAEDIQAAGEKKMQIVMSEMKDKFEELKTASTSKDMEIAALKSEIELLSAFDTRAQNRFAREISAQSELAKSWQKRAEFLTKLNEREGSDQSLPEEGRGRLQKMFDGPELRKFIASGWTLPKGADKRWEQSVHEEDVDPQNMTIAFDPEVEKANRERLGTTGFSARRERPEE